MTCIEGLLGYVHLIPCFMGEGELSAEYMAQLFFDFIVRVFGLPDEVLHDRDPRLTADSWRHMGQFGVKGCLLFCITSPN